MASAVQVEVKPALLEWVRARSGIDDETWAARFTRYNEWLTGARVPTWCQIQEFARKTYTPFGYFFLVEPPNETVPIPDFRATSTRSGSTVVPADLLDTIYLCQARQEWFREHQLRNHEPSLPFVASATTESEPVSVANRMRQILDWTSETRSRLDGCDAAFTKLRENAEAAGVLVMISSIVGSNTHRRLDPEMFRGFALTDEYAALVFINGADNVAAQVFTLAHELAHLWLGCTALSDVHPESTQSFDEERWCNQVAAELLLPIAEFRQTFDVYGGIREQLQPLAEQFCVPTQMILGRIRDIGALTWHQFVTEHRREQQRIAETTAGHSSCGKLLQVNQRFARELIASTLEGHTTYREAYRLLNVTKTSSFEKLRERLRIA